MEEIAGKVPGVVVGAESDPERLALHLVIERRTYSRLTLVTLPSLAYFHANAWHRSSL
jgi:hypothetical protein